MVHLVLSSPKGNQGLRYFPYSGFLGLTPLTVEGVVRTRRDDDPRPLHASSISVAVRCYESRLGRLSILHSNILADYSQLLWSKPDGQDYAPIDELEFPFRITIPVNAPGFSTAVFVDYRCMWRVEAVLTHAPVPVMGSRQVKHFELPLVRYDLPPTPPPSPPPLPLHTSKPRAPRISYSIQTPALPIGPLDIISVPLVLRSLDDDCVIRSASLLIERRIQLNDPPDSLLVPPCYDHPPFNPTASIASDISSNPTITPNSLYPSTASLTPLLPCDPPIPPSPASSSSSSKTITHPIIGADSSGLFVPDSQGFYSKTITLQWPAAKSHSRWTIGETIKSDLVSVRFFARVKLSISSSANGTDSIELAEQELLVVSTNETERQLALARYSTSISTCPRSKSKSPRRMRRDPDAQVDIPPSPAPVQSSSAKLPKGAASVEDGGDKKVVRPRRPHTSAGPRDSKPYYFTPAPRLVSDQRDPHEINGESSSRRLRRADEQVTISNGTHVEAAATVSRASTKRRSGMVSNFFSTSPKIATALSGSSSLSGSSFGLDPSSASSSISSVSTASLSPDVALHDREGRRDKWDDELNGNSNGKRSRKSTELLGFFGFRKRAAPQQQA